MKALLIILLFSLPASGQLTTVNVDSVYFNVKSYGVSPGSFRFDYSTGKFTRSGSQVSVFRGLMRTYIEMDNRLMAAFKVMSNIDSTGCIRDPLAFLNAVKEWYRKE